MSVDTTTPRNTFSRTPDDRFKNKDAANDKWSTISKIGITSFQLDDSFEDDSDPYNSTGRFLVAAIKSQNRD
jgi:hypothetical protein